MRPINLLPPEAFAKRATRRRWLVTALGVIAYLALLGGLTFWWNGRVDAAQSRLDEQLAVNDALSAEVANLTAADDLRAQYDQNVLITSMILAEDIAWGRLLNDFGRLIPERVWLDTFVGTSVPATIPGLVGRVTVAGRGFAFTDVSAWLRSLDEERFPGVAGTWVTSAAQSGASAADDTVLVTFDSTTGLTTAAVSNRLQDRLPEVPG